MLDKSRNHMQKIDLLDKNGNLRTFKKGTKIHKK